MCQASILSTELRSHPFNIGFSVPAQGPRAGRLWDRARAIHRPTSWSTLPKLRVSKWNAFQVCSGSWNWGGRFWSKQTQQQMQLPHFCCSLLEPSTNWREEPQVCQTEKQSYPIQPPCGVLGQGNLARSLSEISRGSRKPEKQGS